MPPVSLLLCRRLLRLAQCKEPSNFALKLFDASTQLLFRARSPWPSELQPRKGLPQRSPARAVAFVRCVGGAEPRRDAHGVATGPRRRRRQHRKIRQRGERRQRLVGGGRGAGRGPARLGRTPVPAPRASRKAGGSPIQRRCCLARQCLAPFNRAARALQVLHARCSPTRLRRARRPGGTKRWTLRCAQQRAAAGACPSGGPVPDLRGPAG